MSDEKTTAAISNLVLVQLPNKLDYLVGAENLDLSGGQICVIFEDGSYQTLSMDNMDLSVSFDSEKEGPSIVKLGYMDKELLMQVHIRQPVIRKFVVSQPPKKREYLAGEKLDLTGLELKAVYETGEQAVWKDIPKTDHTVEVGEAVFPLSIQGITVPIYIKVASAKMVGIRMGKLPNKTEYLERKETLSVTGATIIKIYDSGKEEELPLPMNAVRGFSSLQPGMQTLTVQIGPYTTTFEVRVVEKTPVHLTVISEPVKLNYIEGQPLEMDGLRLSVEYNNGETHPLDTYDYEPKEASLTNPSVKILAEGISTEVAIGVTPRQLKGIQVSKLPDKTKYLEGKDNLDMSGAELQLDYNYGEPLFIPATAEMAHGFDNHTVGECKVELQYSGFFTTFSVEILPAQLIGLLVSKLPDKTDYAPGEVFDKQGMLVCGFYNNGAMLPINSYMITPDGPLTEKDVAVVIVNMDKSAIVPIRVAEMFRKKEEPIPEPVIEVPITPAEPQPAPTAQPEGKKRGLFGGKLFYPSSSKLRDLH